MAATITSVGTFSVGIEGSAISKYVGDCSISITKTGSAVVSNIQTMHSQSGWTPLVTSSLDNLRYGYFSNEGTASVQIASDSAGSKVITTLSPNDHSVIAFDIANIAQGTLFANVPEATSGSVLLYILTDK
jgi:hypothetical protein